MNSLWGLFGTFVLAIGGAILFVGLYTMSQGYVQAYSIQSTPVLMTFDFVGSFVVGFGLWLIVQSGKPDSK
jgi:hypothetical protein